MINRKTARNRMTTVKLADLYGEAAYQAYLAREQQIKKMSYDHAKARPSLSGAAWLFLPLKPKRLWRTR